MIGYLIYFNYSLCLNFSGLFFVGLHSSSFITAAAKLELSRLFLRSRLASAFGYRGYQGVAYSLRRHRIANNNSPDRGLLIQKKEMESLSHERFSPSNWDYFTFLFLCPIAALLFSVSILFIGWLLAWKLVLVHVPLIQEIFGLRKKPNKPKPEGRRRFTQFYNRISSQNSSSEW